MGIPPLILVFFLCFSFTVKSDWDPSSSFLHGRNLKGMLSMTLKSVSLSYVEKSTPLL